MSIDLRLPNIAGTDKEQLAQLRSYLYQLVPQLQWALNTLETSASSNYVQQQPRNAVSTSTPTFDATTAFQDIKALIIKSADIVEAYYDKINAQLKGEYLAISDFGIYEESTEQRINANSEGISQVFSDTQKMYTDLDIVVKSTSDEIANLKYDIVTTDKNIDNVKTFVVESLANIRSGILYYDNGIPVYGLEIGQKNIVDGDEVFNKYARFTSDRLSFYDQNNIEVAYISDQQLYINHVRIKSSLQEGGYKDFIDTNGGIVTKWVGGE